MTTEKQRLDAVQSTHGIWKDLPAIPKPEETRKALVEHLAQYMDLDAIQKTMHLIENHADACIAEEEGWI